MKPRWCNSLGGALTSHEGEFAGDQGPTHSGIISQITNASHYKRLGCLAEQPSSSNELLTEAWGGSPRPELHSQRAPMWGLFNRGTINTNSYSANSKPNRFTVDRMDNLVYQHCGDPFMHVTQGIKHNITESPGQTHMLLTLADFNTMSRQNTKSYIK